MENINNKNIVLQILLGLLFASNLIWLLSPAISSGDGYIYSIISKELLQSGGRWTDLTFLGQDWLDKPHFPFWMMALSFRLFGISAISAVLPGFIFYLIGGLYTYLLTRRLYDKDTALLAAIIYFSIIRLAISATDGRAEAFLVGEIMAAVYYWLQYDNHSKFQHLMGGAVFTALALMTKGLFVAVTIFSGLLVARCYRLGWYRGLLDILSPKWLLAYALTGIGLMPELYSLYCQFDLHPEKIIFGHNQVSGLKWFFWGSQFGRFLGNGYIIQSQKLSLTYYLPILVGSFLPWTVIFVTSLLASKWRQYCYQLVLLLTYFLVTFILFSISRFRYDYYIVIIYPFAAILTAQYLGTLKLKPTILPAAILKFQLFLLYLAMIAIFSLVGYIISASQMAVLLLLPALGITIIIVVYYIAKASLIPGVKITVISGITFMILFNTFSAVESTNYVKHNIGYNVAQTMRQPLYEPGLPLIILNSKYLTFNYQVLFHNYDRKVINLNNKYFSTDHSPSSSYGDHYTTLPQPYHGFILALTEDNANVIEITAAYPQARLVAQYSFIPLDRHFFDVIYMMRMVPINTNLYLV